jgi:SAM-dependent methyltransferase
MMAPGPLELRRAELARYSTLRAMVAEKRFGQRVVSNSWRLDQFGDEAAIRLRDWRAGERVLDVGCGFSPLPNWLQKNYGVEAWGVDDFGGGADGHWRRNQDLEAYQRNFPARYVVELVGDPEHSSLPRRAFDCVYSKLGAHLSPPPHDKIWRHMELLLSDKPGSDLVMIAGCGAPAERNPLRGLALLDEVSALEERILERQRAGQPSSTQFWADVHARAAPLALSPFIYSAYVMDVLGVKGELPSELRAHAYCLDPDALVDPWHVAARRACYTKDASLLRDIEFGRTFALVLGFRRAG